ncbi:MAG TPA: molybdopterin-dependent oxidoreductase [Acidimicrobiales bacterium]|nr:molybdopterin-dependent oxidoreductase [Acidimicrobiales bacterium]
MTATPTAARSETVPVGRRVFLGMVGLGGVGVLVGSYLQRGVGAAVRSISPVAGTGFGALIPGADRFRIYSVTPGLPSIPAASYRLKVTGLVDQPLDLTLADLEAMPRTKLVKDFQCVTGWRVPGVRWDGVQLSHLLDTAGVRPGATALAFDSYDGVYTESLTMDQARRPDVMVAYRFENGPISSDHGGPARLYVAPMYGYKSAKWLSGIRVVNQVEPGYWEQEGYDVDGWVGRSNGRSDQPIG